MKKRKLNLTNYGHALGITSASLLTFIALALLCPAIRKDIYATEYCKGDNGYVECDTTNTINTYARIAPVVSVGMQSDVVMDIVPKSSGVTIEQPVTVTVSTNSSEGYSLYMKTLDATNSMTSTSGTNTNVIAPVDGGAKGVDIATLASQGNVWGYSINPSSASSTETLYQAVPMSQDQPIRKTSSITETNATDTLELTFGLHVDTTLPSGTYTNKVLVSAVANPVTITSLDELVFMQDMTTDICSNTAYDATGETNPAKADMTNPVTKQLIDTRDGKKYWVAKLADGNCWMTQNLALDITEAGLKASDTDITEDWNQNSQYPPVATNSMYLPGEEIPITDNASFETHSWNFGEVLYATPLYNKLCLREGVSNGGSANNTEPFATTCGYVGFIDVENSFWQPTFVAQEGTYRLSDGTDYNGLVAVDATNNTYDAHYLIGNYYQLMSATAGYGGVREDEDEASNSICPKNWQLPTSGLVSFDENGSFAYLLKKYGLATAYNSGVTNNPTNGYNISKAPLYFLRTGNINHETGTVWSVGDKGYSWSGNSRNNGGLKWWGYTLRFTTSEANPSYGTNEGRFGRPVRCLAR